MQNVFGLAHLHNKPLNVYERSALQSLLWVSDNKNECQASNKQIADIMGISASKARRVLQGLQKHGVIEIHRFDAPTPNRYKINLEWFNHDNNN
jgi:DNA-binding IclR family transcriptional regulator